MGFCWTASGAINTGKSSGGSLLGEASMGSETVIKQLKQAEADKTVKASLRAKDPEYRVDLIAAKFNGGGHACAAGLNLKNAPADFPARLLAAVATRLAEVDAARKN